MARQSDSYAFSIHYYLTSSSFFEPGNLNLDSIDGKCAGEFPLIYYLIAILYKLFGINLIYNKIVSTFFLLLGFIYSYKIIYRLSSSVHTSILLSLIFFSSTVLLYYSTLPLPEVTSFGLTLVGCYHLIERIKGGDNTKLWKIYIPLTIASLLKASFFIHEVSAFGVLLLRFRDKKEVK